MRYDPDDASTIVLTTIRLHNWLRSQTVGRAMYTPPEFIDNEDELTGQLHLGVWREEVAHGVVNMVAQGGNRHGQDSLNLRDQWCKYFNGVGAIPWQNAMVL